MKEITNKNHTLTLCIDAWGAQPTALINQKGENVLWKGDSGYWEKHDPILFPTIGNCFGQQIRVEGVPYPMPKHGFAQRMPWKVVEESHNADGEGRLVLELTDTEESRRHYPFSFCIQQTFDVRNDNTLCVTGCVKSDVTVPCMMGAHPAFTLPDFFSKRFGDKRRVLTTIAAVIIVTAVAPCQVVSIQQLCPIDRRYLLYIAIRATPSEVDVSTSSGGMVGWSERLNRYRIFCVICPKKHLKICAIIQSYNFCAKTLDNRKKS